MSRNHATAVYTTEIKVVDALCIIIQLLVADNCYFITTRFKNLDNTTEWLDIQPLSSIQDAEKAYIQLICKTIDEERLMLYVSQSKFNPF